MEDRKEKELKNKTSNEASRVEPVSPKKVEEAGKEDVLNPTPTPSNGNDSSTQAPQ